MNSIRTYRTAFRLALIAASAIVMSGCTLYQSSDREVFDSQGYLKPKSPTPTSQNCLTTTASEALALANTSSPEATESWRILRANDNSTVAFARYLSSEKAALCQFTFDGAFADEEMLSSSRVHLEAFFAKITGL